MKLTSDERARMVDQLDAAKYGGLNDHQRNAVIGLLGQIDDKTARSHVRQALLADRFSLADLLQALRATYATSAAPDKPYHPPNCSGGCEGEGWVPGPARQAAMQAAGETVALARCGAGPEMTQAVWEGLRPTFEAWTDNSRPIDVAALLADARADKPLATP